MLYEMPSFPTGTSVVVLINDTIPWGIRTAQKQLAFVRGEKSMELVLCCKSVVGKGRQEHSRC